MDELIYTFNFRNNSDEYIVIHKRAKDKVGEVINEYLNKVQKSNLFLNLSIDNIYFFYNARKIIQSDFEKKIDEYFGKRAIYLILVENNYSKINYEIIDTIKDNIFTSVYKAKLVNKNGRDKYVAVKKI